MCSYFYHLGKKSFEVEGIIVRRPDTKQLDDVRVEKVEEALAQLRVFGHHIVHALVHDNLHLNQWLGS